MKKYKHDEEMHNLLSPKEIVPEIIKLFHPKSVVDVGCGLGTFLYCFKERGINDVLGIDGPWANHDLLFKYLSPDEFLEKDLEKPFNLKTKYDLVISLEVAEHISEKSSDIFIENLISAGELILFSAAIPFQGGQNHVNEQWIAYWESKFLKHNYVVYDVLKPIFWDNPKIFWWYKQNMVIFAPKGFEFKTEVSQNQLKNVIHYDLYSEKTKKVDDVFNGELSVSSYFKLVLKSLIGNKNAKKIKRLLMK